MIKIERAGPVMLATFSQPSKLNALDGAMAAELDKLTALLHSSRDLGLLVLRGAGRAFMAGGDIGSFRGDDATVAAAVEPVLSSLNDFIKALEASPCLALASVHGPVAGGGLSIMLACDLAIASDNARFVFAYSALGASPDGGIKYNLPAIVGRPRALQLLLASGPIDAGEAHRLGLVNEVVPLSELQERTHALAMRLIANSGPANAATKKLVRAAAETPLREQLEAEKRSFLSSAKEPDFKEGVAAFFDKRPPRFGRSRYGQANDRASVNPAENDPATADPQTASALAKALGLTPSAASASSASV